MTSPGSVPDKHRVGRHQACGQTDRGYRGLAGSGQSYRIFINHLQYRLVDTPLDVFVSAATTAVPDGYPGMGKGQLQLSNLKLVYCKRVARANYVDRVGYGLPRQSVS